MRRIAILGLGYVGLPLAVALGRVSSVIGFDINSNRVNELNCCYDRNGQVPEAEFRDALITFTSDPGELVPCDFIIITVPTPIDNAKKPDLTPLIRATETAGKVLKKGTIVVYESTVYPGATEEVCLPILERISGLCGGRDFFVGYSPERINPGDKTHTLHNV
ncbi:MAG: Vi polysaccharide biosynthesis UDP-N-acetylglucosamine C-6 dehydrogenase TviB, partial [Chitinophagaceae bacterium]|nr:Vi polysaccharide biosynthesis UDP-N-acetylglucosamine C-6 dehydrogenase TviB [Chitinophagaceae bacterium]